MPRCEFLAPYTILDTVLDVRWDPDAYHHLRLSARPADPDFPFLQMRSGYRIAEFAGGVNGFLSTHEGYFYIFDTLPLCSVMDL
ncbi:hypothetical protein B0H11DRAFT_2214278 [Mycena galericulata]|nr:hypothetical protein B0H11DRAFT_2214278 [Mycena galericulata]